MLEINAMGTSKERAFEGILEVDRSTRTGASGCVMPGPLVSRTCSRACQATACKTRVSHTSRVSQVRRTVHMCRLHYRHSNQENTLWMDLYRLWYDFLRRLLAIPAVAPSRIAAKAAL